MTLGVLVSTANDLTYPLLVETIAATAEPSNNQEIELLILEKPALFSLHS